MAMTELAKEYYEKMLPGHISTLQATDPEFVERFDSFAFDEVINMPDIDSISRLKTTARWETTR